MKTLVFIDGIGGPYDANTLNSSAKIGGTEITLIRVAELLSQKYNVYVAEEHSQNDIIINNVNYISLAKITERNIIPNVLIVIRPRRLVVELARKFPQSKIFYWMHDIPTTRLWKYKRKFSQLRCDIIAISVYQTQLIEQAWRGNFIQQTFDKFFPVKNPLIYRIYNPINSQLRPDSTAVNKNKLLFYSAPDRGLEQIVFKFKQVQQQLQNFILYIAHPGYSNLARYEHLFRELSNVRILGSLSHQEIIQHVREAFCIFYPQTKKPECFGLVYAEANAVGTPVLAHNFGAAAEVLEDHSQLIDGNNISEIVLRLKSWQNHVRPQIQLAEKFREKSVLEQWENIL